MKKLRIKLIALLLLSSVILSFVGCTQKENGMDRDSNINTNTSVPNCKINGREFYFVSDEAKREWKEPLAKLLSNVLIE